VSASKRPRRTGLTHGIEHELAWLKAVYEASEKYGIGALLEAFRLCVRNGRLLPQWLAQGMHDAAVKGVKKTRLKHYRQWREVRRIRDVRARQIPLKNVRGVVGLTALMEMAQEIGHDDTFKQVAHRLKNTGAAGKASAIETVYGEVEKSLPPSLRVERTHRKRQRSG
jgi:hypothetical protein